MNFPDKVYKTGPRLFAVIAKSKSMYGQLTGKPQRREIRKDYLRQHLDLRALSTIDKKRAFGLVKACEVGNNHVKSSTSLIVVRRIYLQVSDCSTALIPLLNENHHGTRVAYSHLYYKLRSG